MHHTSLPWALLWYYRVVNRVLERFIKGIIGVLQGCYSGVIWFFAVCFTECYRNVIVFLQGFYMGVTGVLWECYLGVTGVVQGFTGMIFGC